MQEYSFAIIPIQTTWKLIHRNTIYPKDSYPFVTQATPTPSATYCSINVYKHILWMPKILLRKAPTNLELFPRNRDLPPPAQCYVPFVPFVPFAKKPNPFCCSSQSGWELAETSWQAPFSLSPHWSARAVLLSFFLTPALPLIRRSSESQLHRHCSVPWETVRWRIESCLLPWRGRWDPLDLTDSLRQCIFPCPLQERKKRQKREREEGESERGRWWGWEREEGCEDTRFKTWR